MSDDLVKQSLLELQDLVRCRCHPAYTGRGMHDPDCECDSVEAVKVVADRIEELENICNQLAKKLGKVEVLMALGFAENERRLALAGDALEHAKLNMPHPDQMIDDAIAQITGGKDET